MEYRSLGRTGVQVSMLCLGCMNFGSPTPEGESMDIIDKAIDGGINFLDTANVYSRGVSEEVVGRALKRNGKRGQIVLATKVHGRMDDDNVLAAGNNRRHIIEQCEACPYCERISESVYFCTKYDQAFPVVRDSKKPGFCTTNWIRRGDESVGDKEWWDKIDTE